MAYDLSKYRLQPGDLVEVHSGRCAGLSQRLEGTENVLVAEWDFAKGNQGRVVRVWLPHPNQNEPPWVIVEPLPEFGFGQHTFAAKHIHKVEESEA